MTTSKGKAEHKYKLRFMPEAVDERRNLDRSVQANLKNLLAERLDNPASRAVDLMDRSRGATK